MIQPKESYSNDTVTGASKPTLSSKRDAWDKVIDAKDNIEDAAHKAGKQVRGYIDTASDEIAQASDTVKTQIRSNPVQSTVIALVAGLILGRFFRI